ncbi:TIR-like protein FxsC [Streptomyces sp. AS02]|uniref:TIR-like protein FxsC n=1 Tax=Streptomyces sp. AS02 TaxID=2938946 RepID=UPI0020202E51|nr:TIR-like protein FxsC [Streptomyces sp. AS02]MCL8013674.1 TIR-like protein FxsC [Streptomyces sp. AS02]
MAPLRADATAPYFFLSYAHTPRDETDESDPDVWVHRLFRDLCEDIRQLTAVPLGASGYMDRSMRAGQLWTTELGDALAACRVFVPLYSPRYFHSSWCGKEWTIFANRAARYRTEGRRGTPGAIVPALWAPIEDHQLPETVKDIQYRHPELGDRYRDYGFYGLMKLSSQRRHYQRAVFELARRIIEVGRSVVVEPGETPAWDAVHDTFATLRTGRVLRITVAAGSLDRLPEGRSPDYYGPSALDWNPFRPECPRPLAEMAAAIAERNGFRPDLQAFDTWHSEAGGTPSGGGSAAAAGPEVMLLDRWLLRDPEQRTRLSKFDAAHRPATGLMVPWNDDDPDSEDAKQALTAETAATLPRTVSQAEQACRPAVRGIPDHESFDALLPRVVQWAAAQHLKQAPAQPPPGRATPRFRLSIAGHDDNLSPVHRPHAEEEDRDEQP